MYYSLFLFTLILPPPQTWHKLPPPIYLNGLILFPNKTLPLPLATYLYIYNVYGVVAWYSPIWWLLLMYSKPTTSAHVVVKLGLGKQGAEGGHSMRSAKKIHAFYWRGVVCGCVLCGDVNGRGSRRSNSCVHWI